MEVIYSLKTIGGLIVRIFNPALHLDISETTLIDHQSIFFLDFSIARL